MLVELPADTAGAPSRWPRLRAAWRCRRQWRTPPTPIKRGRRTATGTGAANDGRRPDRVFLPNAKDPIPIRPNSAEMFVLAHLRDEAHRFAVAFHRGQRRRRTLRSALSDITGIGASRQRELLRHFGSVRKIRDASLEDLLRVPGMGPKAAEAVRAYFDAHGELAPPVSAAPQAPAEAQGDGDAGEGAGTTAELDAEGDAAEAAEEDAEEDARGRGGVGVRPVRCPGRQFGRGGGHRARGSRRPVVKTGREDRS